MIIIIMIYRYLILLIVLSPVNAIADGKIVVGYNHVPPDTMHINNKAAGPANEYIKRVFEKMGLEVEFKFMPLARLMSSVNNNKIDCINRIGANKKLKVIPEVPFTSTVPGVLFRKGIAPEAINSSKDLWRFKIATKVGMPLTDSMKPIHNQIHYVGGTDALLNAIKMMLKGRIDGVYSPTIGELVFMANSLNASSVVAPRKLPDPPWNVYVAFSPNAYKKHYESYKIALKKVEKTSPYKKEYKRFLEENIPNLSKESMKVLMRPSVK